MRTKFTDEQRDALEAFFNSDPRLTHDTLEGFANDNNLTISAVRNWVNNRKQRLKRNCGSSFEGNDTKYLKTEQLVNGDEDSSERRGSGQDVSSKVTSPGFCESDGDEGARSPCGNGIPTMVNGSTIRNEIESGEAMLEKPRQGNGLSSSTFTSSSGIPTMVENIAMNCMTIPAE